MASLAKRDCQLSALVFYSTKIIHHKRGQLEMFYINFYEIKISNISVK